jgi:hypothetical protein
MPAVNGVGKPCAGEPHARIDGRELETERDRARVTEMKDTRGNPVVTSGSETYRRSWSPRQFSTLQRELAGDALGHSVQCRSHRELELEPLRQEYLSRARARRSS